MARTIAEIKAGIVAAKNADSNLSGLTSSSNVAEWNLWASIVATCQWTLETLFDLHVAEVNNIIYNMKSHTLQWYAQKAMAFQNGDTLPYGSDVYAMIDPTKQVVKYAAAQEIGGIGNKYISLALAQSATDSFTGDTVCAQITDAATLAALSGYITQIKDAGISVSILSHPGDIHKCTATIYYDPQILNASGQRVDGTDNYPLDRAIAKYLNNLPFQGLITVDAYVAAVSAVPGIISFKLSALTATENVISGPTIDILAQSYYRSSAGYLTYTVGSNQTFTWTVFNP